MCEYHCYEIGGPYIAENPDCPIHGERSSGREDRLEAILEQVRDGHIAPQHAVDMIEEEYS